MQSATTEAIDESTGEADPVQRFQHQSEAAVPVISNSGLVRSNMRGVLTIPKRSPDASIGLLDLTSFYSASLCDDLHLFEGNNLKELPGGLQKMGDQRFDLRGIIQLASTKTDSDLPGYPHKVEAISVGLKCRSLHFIGGCAWSAQNGAAIANCRVHYRDGVDIEFPLSYGTDVRNWWFSEADAENEKGGAQPVWKGYNSRTKNNWPHEGIRLYQPSWTNPRPDIEIQNIDLISTMTEAALFVIAITAEPNEAASDAARITPLAQDSDAAHRSNIVAEMTTNTMLRNLMIPKRSTNAPDKLINLSSFYNASFDDNWQYHKEEGLKPFSVPRGIQRLKGVEFDVRAVIQLASQQINRLEPGYPDGVFGIDVKQQARKLYFLHGLAWGHYEVDGRCVARYVVHFADGQSDAIDVINGRDVRQWLFGPDLVAQEKDGAEAVWKGPKEKWESEYPAWGVRFYMQTWTNPRPEVAIKSIDLISTMTQAAPFVIAITVDPVVTKDRP